MGPDTETLNDRSRKDADAHHGAPRHGSSVPTTLRLLPAHEFPRGRADLDQTGSAQEHNNRSKSVNKDYDSGSSSDQQPPFFSEGEDPRPGRSEFTALRPSPRIRESDSQIDENVQADPVHTADSSPSRFPQLSQVPSVAHSLTSLSLDSQAPLSSLPSSPKSTSRQSFQNRDEDPLEENNSEAVASSSEDEAEQGPSLQGSAPQLVMPSIKMPSRRPFTERGKAMGRLKILVAGDSGMESQGC